MITRLTYIFLLAFLGLSFSVSSQSTIKKVEAKTEFEPDYSTDICIPDAFDSALDSLTFTYYVKHAQKGNCKKKHTENPYFPDSIYKQRLAKLPYVVEMPYNTNVQAFIDFYAGKKRKQVEHMLGLGKYYFPMFEDILNQYGIPLEFRNLAVIESALNTNAVSRVGAGGLWQFMPSTGKMYGLRINSLVDERCDPVKSTHAAARYLKDLYRIYHDWHLAIAAYNCGPGTINKAIRRSGGKRDYWSIYPYLPAETRSYVPIFIAANYVMTYYEQHNLCPVRIDMPVYTDTVKITQRVHFDQISEVLNISVEELKVLNPQYRKNIIPGDAGDYVLRLPTHYATKFDGLRDSIYKYKQAEIFNDSSVAVMEIKEATKVAPPKKKNITHKVKRGDTLTGIAEKYDVKVSDIKKWNGLRRNTIQLGQRLIIKRK